MLLLATYATGSNQLLDDSSSFYAIHVVESVHTTTNDRYALFNTHELRQCPRNKLATVQWIDACALATNDLWWQLHSCTYDGSSVITSGDKPVIDALMVGSSGSTTYPVRQCHMRKVTDAIDGGTRAFCRHSVPC